MVGIKEGVVVEAVETGKSGMLDEIPAVEIPGGVVALLVAGENREK